MIMKSLDRIGYLVFNGLLALFVLGGAAMATGIVIGALAAMLGALIAVTVGYEDITTVSSIMFWCAGGIATVATFSGLLFKSVEIAKENAKKDWDREDDEL
jgi:hypothetical protein